MGERLTYRHSFDPSSAEWEGEADTSGYEWVTNSRSRKLGIYRQKGVTVIREKRCWRGLKRRCMRRECRGMDLRPNIVIGDTYPEHSILRMAPDEMCGAVQ